MECLIFACENGEVVWPLNGRWQDWRNIDLTTSWYRVTCDESGYIVIEVQPKTPESQGNRNSNLPFTPLPVSDKTAIPHSPDGEWGIGYLCFFPLGERGEGLLYTVAYLLGAELLD